MFQKIINNKILLFILFLTLSFLFKISSILNTSISNDEATYILIGKAIFNGKIYLFDMWDFKPIGIFLLFGFICKYISDSVLAIRIISVFFVAITAFFIHLLLQKQGKKSISFFAGLTYIIMISAHGLGINSNTELFFNLFTILGFYFFIVPQKTIFKILSGLFFGTGFLIKYVTAFDLAGILTGLFLINLLHKDKLKNILLIKNSLLAFSGFILPLLILNTYYCYTGYYHEFTDSIFGSGKVYSTNIWFNRELRFFIDFNLSYLPMVFGFYLSLSRMKKFHWILPLSWFVCIFIAITLQGKHFTHYFIQLFIPVSIFSLYFIVDHKHNLLKIIKITGIVFVLIFFASSIVKQYELLYKKEDAIKQASNYLKVRIFPEQTIFSSEQPVYYYLNKVPLSKYYHATLLLEARHTKAAKIDKNKELENIFNQKPDYLVLKKKYIKEEIWQIVNEDYELINVFGKDFCVFKRNKAKDNKEKS